jgi:hypothetical protein
MALSDKRAVREYLRMTNLRTVTDDHADATGIRWRKTYIGNLVLGAVCADCGEDGMHHLHALKSGGYDLRPCAAAQAARRQGETP